MSAIITVAYGATIGLVVIVAIGAVAYAIVSAVWPK